MQKQITCNLNKSRLKQPNAGGVCYVTHFRTYIITHDRGQREADQGLHEDQRNYKVTKTFYIFRRRLL